MNKLCAKVREIMIDRKMNYTQKCGKKWMDQLRLGERDSRTGREEK